MLLGLALILIALCLPREARAQELNCSVNLDISQLSGSDYDYLRDLEGRIREYLNERRWTDDRYRAYERIDCTFQIFVERTVGIQEFTAQLVVASRRPIYDTAQTTPTFRVKDQWTFEFSRGQSLLFEPNTFDPLTSVLDFYAYIILGYDYDTFSPLGGTTYFREARRIADLANTSNATGWQSLGNDQTRTALISELLRPRLRRLREVSYAYHLDGLDRFVESTEEARTTIMSQLEVLQSLTQDVSRSYALDVFFATKFEEFAAVFRDSRMSSEAYSILTSIDPSHSSTYNELVN
ncbi:DUF4835 domain-containing protein [Longibacter salinarum]|uniref:DUF4835 domain-containing protein n=1 Tax=Longibacter salinarum TaxID=1850348 RepID=A0A2A8D3E8_9BACT|nr:DUF4835 family protein [Longibacter salinarum]PEN15404.1 DUF4835 domain-containing protein [Longibacter salinarum]